MTNTEMTDKPLIPNTQIESWFLRICTDEQMTKYKELVASGYISLGTAYASNTINRIFYKLVDNFEDNGQSIEQLVSKKGAK